MRVLIIDTEAKAAIKKMVAFAEANHYTTDDILDMMNGDTQIAGNDPDHIVDPFQGYKVVFSIEEQNAGPTRHLSVSVDTPGRVPNFPALQMIMDEIGFTRKVEECKVETEAISQDPEHHAVNVWEVI